MLVHESRRRRALGGGLYFYRVKDEVRRLLERGGYLQALGPENLFPVKNNVIASIYPRLDMETCRRCRHRLAYLHSRFRLSSNSTKSTQSRPYFRAMRWQEPGCARCQ